VRPPWRSRDLLLVGYEHVGVAVVKAIDEITLAKRPDRFFDGQLSYDFAFVPPVENQPVAGYSKDARDVTPGKDGKTTESAVRQTVSIALPLWKQVLNGTAITIGCNDIFGTDSPKAHGFGDNSTGYPGFIYDATGRFVYLSLTKKF
jgi:hypothetical protein